MSISVFEAARPVIKGLIVAVLAIIGAYIGHWAHGAMLNDYTPVQPIEFSHEIHAGENEIACEYCHSWAGRSATAGVPSVETCVGCHRGLTEVRDTPDVVKLFDYWERGEGIPWVKVHDTPDFVHFRHKPHIRGGVECQTCHGPVEEMVRVTRRVDLNENLRMPWCIDCHTEEDVANGRDCLTCHY